MRQGKEKPRLTRQGEDRHTPYKTETTTKANRVSSLECFKVLLVEKDSDGQQEGNNRDEKVMTGHQSM